MNTVPFLDHFTRRKYPMDIVMDQEQEISWYMISFEVRFQAHLTQAVWFLCELDGVVPSPNASQYIYFQPELPVDSINNNSDKFSVRISYWNRHLFIVMNPSFDLRKVGGAVL